MSPLLPTPLLVLAGVIGFALALPRLERPTSALRLAAEAFAIGVLTCLGFVAAWALSWWVGGGGGGRPSGAPEATSMRSAGAWASGSRAVTD